MSKESAHAAQNGARAFLTWLKRGITEHSLTDLINETKKRHARDDFAIDNELLIFGNQRPLCTFRQRAVYVKGIFKANHCPLQASIDNHYAAKTAKISEGILEAIFDAQDQETKDLMEFQAYSGERIGCLSGDTGNNPVLGTHGLRIDQIEPCDEKYAIVRIQSHQTKARYAHICVIPRQLAERIIENARRTQRAHPFPNFENLWRTVTRYALKQHGVRLTSHYLRKRFATIAQKTAMPVNSWDFLMGDRMTTGHEANVYTLEDWTELVADYDKHLAPRLGFGNADASPLNDIPTQNMATFLHTINNLNATINDLREELNKLKRQTRLAKLTPPA